MPPPPPPAGSCRSVEGAGAALLHNSRPRRGWLAERATTQLQAQPQRRQLNWKQQGAASAAHLAPVGVVVPPLGGVRQAGERLGHGCRHRQVATPRPIQAIGCASAAMPEATWPVLPATAATISAVRPAEPPLHQPPPLQPPRLHYPPLNASSAPRALFLSGCSFSASLRYAAVPYRGWDTVPARRLFAVAAAPCHSAGARGPTTTNQPRQANCSWLPPAGRSPLARRTLLHIVLGCAALDAEGLIVAGGAPDAGHQLALLWRGLHPPRRATHRRQSAALGG